MPHRRIREIVSGQHLVHAPSSTSVREAAIAMRAQNVAAVVVADPNGVLDGIFTERDVVNRIVADGLSPEETRLCDVMTRNPAHVRPDQTVRDAMQLMEGHGVRHLPVCEDGRVIGIVSMRDFVAQEVAELEITHEVDDHLAKVIW